MKIKSICVILSLLAALIAPVASVFPTAAFADDEAVSFSGGIGTNDEPYLIASSEELELINDYGCGDMGAGVYFKLTANLDNANVVIGSAQSPFQGIFKGAGHSIGKSCFKVIGANGEVHDIYKQAAINSVPIAEKNKGLIENCDIDFVSYSTSTLPLAGNYKTLRNIGAVVNENSGTVRGCKVDNFIGSSRDNLRGICIAVGGICGYNIDGIIEECDADLNIMGYTSSSYSLGSIAGANDGGIIRNCIGGGRIACEGSKAGGIVGASNGGTIENCKSSTLLKGSFEYFGAVAGAVYGNCIVTGCHFNSNTADGGGALIAVGNSRAEDADYGNTSEEMSSLSTYAGWDFDYIWYQSDTGGISLRAEYSFRDIISHWAKSAIDSLKKYEYIDGYEDGTFRPDNTVTKAEFIKMFAEAIETEPIYEVSYDYEDIPDWAAPYVSAAYNAGWLENIAAADNALGADNEITRLEAAVIVGRAAGNNGGTDLEFTDISDIPVWAKEPLAEAGEYIKGYEDGTFRPDNTLTRAEAAQIIYNIIIK